MNTLIGTPIDHKNIGLLKLLYKLRVNLDIYCLISVNADGIEQSGVGINFFGYIQQVAIETISLIISKIYETEKKHELNSIHGVFRHLCEKDIMRLDNKKLESFIQKYNGPSAIDNPISALESTIEGFKKKYGVELERFKTFRNKKVAHDEFSFNCDSLPSYDAMVNLFLFGVDFHELVASVIGVVPYDLREEWRIKGSLETLLQKLGIEDIKTDFEIG